MGMHENYMRRCIELATKGAGHVAPNPLVGSVLVCNDRIIGEGYHRQYGQAHAEVNCINSVNEADTHLINKSTIYVSLEPCAHFGKTPPCADLIIRKKIPAVVIGCRDPFVQVDGKGIEKLNNAGIETNVGILENECKALNKRFFTFHTRQRPYIILKWAQSNNHKIANADMSRVLISNEYSNRLVHKWRSHEAGIVIGTNTALHDNPQLNTRNWTGPNPVRLVVDKHLRLPLMLAVFDKTQRTVVLNYLKSESNDNLVFYKIDKNLPLVEELLKACCQLNIQSILVEGGTRLLEGFIQASLWDEARVIESRQLVIHAGINAPTLTQHCLDSSEEMDGDVVHCYSNENRMFII